MKNKSKKSSEHVKTDNNSKQKQSQETSCCSATNSSSGASSKNAKAIKAELEKQLDAVDKKLKNSTNSSQGRKCEEQGSLLESKLVILAKLKFWEEVVEEGYKILGRRGPSTIVYKCLIVGLCRLNKFEELAELLGQWKLTSPKSLQMAETKRKMEGFLSGIRSGVNPETLLTNLEEVISLYSENVSCSSESNGQDHVWKYRNPPSRHITFSLCPRISAGENCMYGDECISAHSKAELLEWQSRINGSPPEQEMAVKSSRRTRDKSSDYRFLPPACMHYIVGLLEKIEETNDLNTLFVGVLPDVRLKFSSPLAVSKLLVPDCMVCHKWTFMVASKRPMATVTLLQDAHRDKFSIIGAYFFNSKQESINLIELHPNNKSQKGIQVLNTFIRPDLFLPFNNGWPDWCCYQIDLLFQIHPSKVSPGLYHQDVIFDFKSDPKLLRNLSVYVQDSSYALSEKTESISDTSLNIMPGNSDVIISQVSDDDTISESELCPNKSGEVLDVSLTRENYVSFMNQFILSEIKARQEELSKLNGVYSIEFSSVCNPVDSAVIAELPFPVNFVKDESVQRLFLESCSNVSIETHVTNSGVGNGCSMCPIVEKSETMIYVQLPLALAEELNLNDLAKTVKVWFHLDHEFFDLLRACLAGLSEHHLNVLFPLFLTHRLWNFKDIELSVNTYLNLPLNSRQKDVIREISLGHNDPILTPVIVTGPSGTGKTYTLACGAAEISKSRGGNGINRVLICTYSNYGANKCLDYICKFMEKDKRNVSNILRLYDKKYPVRKVQSEVLKFCLVDTDDNNRTAKFQYPTVDELLSRQIVILTFPLCLELLQLGLPDGTFSHIFIDQCEKMLEVEAMCSVFMGGKNSLFVLFGDLQMLTPELHSFDSTHNGTLMHRLQESYPIGHPSRITLVETYGQNSALVKFISDHFYSSSLVTSLDTSLHPSFNAISFYVVPNENSSVPEEIACCENNSHEVLEITDRIRNLVRAWPSCWGSPKESSIAVISPSPGQVDKFKNTLRIEGLSFVDVLNLNCNLDKQYKVVFLSLSQTISHAHLEVLVKANVEVENSLYMDPRAIYSVISRTQNALFVVGDCQSLCNLGSCRYIWRSLINTCKLHNSFFGSSQVFPKSEENNNIILSPKTPSEALPESTFKAKHSEIRDAYPLTNTESSSSIWNLSPIPSKTLLKPVSPHPWNVPRVKRNLTLEEIWGQDNSTGISQQTVPKVAEKCESESSYYSSKQQQQSAPCYDNPFELPDVKLLAEMSLSSVEMSESQSQGSSLSSSSGNNSRFKSICRQVGGAVTLNNRNNNSSSPSLSLYQSDEIYPTVASRKSMMMTESSPDAEELFSSCSSFEIAQAKYAYLHGSSRRVGGGFSCSHNTALAMRSYRHLLTVGSDSFGGFNAKPTPRKFDFTRELGLTEVVSPTISSSSNGSIGNCSGFLGDQALKQTASVNYSSEFPDLGSQPSDWIEVKNPKKGKNSSSCKKRAAKKKEKDEPAGELCVEEKIESLKEMGFEKRKIIKALQACNKDLERAVEWLIKHGSNGSYSPVLHQ